MSSKNETIDVIGKIINELRTHVEMTVLSSLFFHPNDFKQTLTVMLRFWALIHKPTCAFLFFKITVIQCEAFHQTCSLAPQ